MSAIRGNYRLPGSIQSSNQRGIESLSLFEFDTATRNFVEALREIREMQRSRSSEETEEGGDPPILQPRAAGEGEEEKREDISIVIDLESSAPILGDRESVHEELSNCPIWLYDKAFLPSVRVRNQDWEQDELLERLTAGQPRRRLSFSVSDDAKISAAILYNTALTYHLRGLSNNSQMRIRDYHKALHLYQLTLNTLHIGQPEENIQSCRVLALAIYNNMAHIYFQRLDFVSYGICIDFLRQLLMAGQPTLEDAYFEVNIFLANRHENPNAATA